MNECLCVCVIPFVYVCCVCVSVCVCVCVQYPGTSDGGIMTLGTLTRIQMLGEQVILMTVVVEGLVADLRQESGWRVGWGFLHK